VESTILRGFLLVLLTGTFPWKLAAQARSSSSATDAPREEAQKAHLIEAYGNLPLRFEPNQGQTDNRVKFLSRDFEHALFLTPTEAVLVLRKPEGDSRVSSASRIPSPWLPGAVLRMKLRGANQKASATGMEALPGTSNYFLGDDPAKWRSNIPTYREVRFSGVYPGVDLVYYGNERELEYDFVITPGGDPNKIKMGIQGANLAIDAEGNAVLLSNDRTMRLLRPRVYQEFRGQRKEVSAVYVLKGHDLRIAVGPYDHAQTLTIDPVLGYSTYLGGSGGDSGGGIAVDSSGNTYIVGSTSSTDFPTNSAFQSMLGGPGTFNVFITKLNAAGSALIYSTYLGGNGGNGTFGDNGASIAVDSSGNAYFTGTVSSTNFPTFPKTGSPLPFQPAFGGGQVDAFVAELNSSGNALVYSTYLGGSGNDSGTSIAVDSFGDAYVTGSTTSINFPVASPLQATLGTTSPEDAFVAKVNPTGSALVYSTYLGGNDNSTFGGSIAVDSSGNAYVAGSTIATNFPVTAGALQTTYGGAPEDAFVAKLNAAGSALVYSTYLGGSGDDFLGGLAVDSSGNAYVTGATNSTNFPTTPGAEQTTFGGGTYNVFVSKLNPAGNALVYSTYLGGSGNDQALGIALDFSGNAYVTGLTSSTNFPVSNAIQSVYAGGAYDVFVTELGPAGTALIYSTYLGGSGDDEASGIAVDASGDAYVTGFTNSANFPVNGAFQGTNKVPNSGYTAFVTKIATNVSGTGTTATSTTLSSSMNPSVYGQSVTLTATVTTASGSPTQTVSFFDGASSLGSSTLTAGQGSFSIALLTAGTHSITATYNGDSTFAPSTSSAISQSVTQSATTTVLSTSPTASVFGQAVKLTATVTSTSGGGRPTGTVAFNYGQTSVGTASAVSGSETLTTTVLPVGTDSITAVYQGDSNFTSSTSPAISELVLPGVPTFSTNAIPVGTGPIAMALNTATNKLYIANEGSNTVSVLDVGTNSVITTINVGTAPAAVGVNEQTNLIYVADSGSDDVAVIDGASNTLLTKISIPSSTPQAITVDPRTNEIFVGTVGTGAGTVPYLAVINGATNGVGYPDPSGLGGPIAAAFSPLTNRAYVLSYADANIEEYLEEYIIGPQFLIGFTSRPGRPTAVATDPASGKVYVVDGLFPLAPTSIGAAEIVDESNNSITSIPAGVNPYSVAADPAGNTVYVADQSSAPGVSATVMAIDDASNSVFATYIVGQTPVPAKIPAPNKMSIDSAGNLVYVANEASNDVSVIYANSQASSQGTVSVGTTPSALLLDGNCNVYVANFGSGTLSVLKHTVNGPGVCLSKSSLVFGSQLQGTTSASQSVTITNNGTSVLTINSITGTGNFSEAGSCTPGATSVQIGPGQTCTIQASFAPTTNGLQRGYLTITSNFSNSPTYISLAGDGVAPTTTQVAVTPNPSVYGQALVLTATVTSNSPGIPTGLMTFYVNGSALKTVKLTSSGPASYNAALLLPVGSQQNFTAQYSGDIYFATSTSPAVALVVNKASTYIGTTFATPNPPTSPQTLTAAVSVSSPGGGTGTGTVVFQEGQTILGTAALNGVGLAAVPASLPGGPHSISVTYQGDSNFLPSSSPQPLNLSVPISTVTTLTSTPSALVSTYGTPVTLTATVTASVATGGNLGGTVTFWDGPTFIGSFVLSGTATSGSVVTPASTFAVGQHSITAVFQDVGSIFLDSKSARLLLTLTQAGTVGGPGGCACSLTGAYASPVSPVAPSGAMISPGAKYIVTYTDDTSNTATGASLSVARYSNGGAGATVLPQGNFPSDTNWGFSPDDDRFVVHSVSGGMETVYVYDLTTGGPNTQPRTIVSTNSAANLTSSALSFSPSGRYFMYEFLYNNGGPTGPPQAEIQIYQVQSVASQMLLYDRGPFAFVSVPGSGEDGFGVLGQGFSPDNPESTFVYSYLTGSTQSQWQLVSLVKPQTVLTQGTLTDLADFWQYSPCGDVVALVKQNASGTPVAEIDLFTAATGAAINPGGYGVSTINGLSLLCVPPMAGSPGGQAVSINGQQPVVIAPNTGCSNTPFGSNVSVVPADSGGSGQAPVTVTFASVTNAGTTTLVTSSPTGQSIPGNFQLGIPPVVFDLTTNATFTSAQVCISYVGISFGSSNPNLVLFHYENGQWLNRTVSVDTMHQIICASVNSFSPFVVAAQVSTIAATSTGISLSANPSVFGQSVTLMATVTSSAGIPTGTVAFLDGALTIGTGTLDASGAASLATSSLTTGAHFVTAAYTGNSSFAASTSPALSQTVSPATPMITWLTPTAIPYGTTLSAKQLSATANVAGSFVYSPAAGAVPTAGSQTLTATFTPTDTADYATASATVSLVVNEAAPVITWANPAAITYGTALSATQLNATANVAGSFVYTPASGTVPTAGSQTLSVSFTPTDATDYTAASASVTLVVNAATPVISWTTPAAITYGTALSAAQLNATANTSGRFVYTPASGTVLPAGSQTLSVTFTPADATDFTTASANVTLLVNKAAPAITWAIPTAITYGTALGATQLNATTNTAGTFVYSPVSGTVLPAGSQTLSVTFTPTDATDFTTTTASVNLVVNKAAPAITWANPAAITYGTALGATQLSAAASVAGSFVYSPTAGTVVSAGSQTLSVTFTPTNAIDYTTATATVALVVNRATPTITWAMPAAITLGTVLSGTQLNATASVPGTFVYTPPAGTMLSLGNQTLSVAFTPADANDYTTAAAAVTLMIVNKYPTSTTITASPNPALLSQSVTFTATVTGTSPSGSVQFKDGTTNLGSAVTLSSGRAPLSISTLAVGSHSITAVYSGDISNGLSTSATLLEAVRPTPLTVTANSASRQYGQANPAFTVSYSGFVNADTPTSLSGTLNCTTTVTQTSQVGAYAITCSGLTSSNYTITFVPGTLTVTKATLTVTAKNATKAFNTPNPAFTWSASEFVNGDGTSVLTPTPTCTTTATTTSPVGSYPITCSGAAATNYALSYVSGTLSVTCHYVSFTLSPSSVAVGGKVTVNGTVMSCTSTTQTVSVQFTLAGPLQPGSCANAESVMFTTPPFALPANAKQTMSFPSFVPRNACPGSYTITAKTLVSGKVVDTSSATLAVTAH